MNSYSYKIMKRCLLILLAALLSVGSVWAYDFYDGSFYYNILTSSTVELTYDDSDEPELYSGSVTIPATVKHGGNTYSVVAVGQAAFSDCTELTSVTFGSNIASIGISAFEGCSGLTEITIPSEVTEILDYAFYGTGILTLVIPDNVTTINSQAFGNCNDLYSVTIGKNVTSIASDAFTNSDITELYWNAIQCAPYSFGTLEEIVFGDQVDTIPNSICSDETNLYSITFGANTKVISDYAFSGCSGLTSIDLPSGLISMGTSAFDGCSGITSITIPSGITELANDVFYGTSITEINISDNITTIGARAFGNCDKLTDVTIGKNVTLIESDAFAGSTKISKLTWNAINCKPYSFGTLEKVVFGDLIDTIPKDMCLDETHLSSITFGANTKVVGESAFSGCSYLDSVTFSAGITTIGKYAFFGCTDLSDIKWSADLTTIGISAFEDCTSIESISFPESLTSLGTYAFAGCKSLRDITFPTTITELQEGVFAATGITSLVLPDNITKVGEFVFANCDSLTNVTIGANVTSIGYDAFEGSTNITILTWNAINCKPYSFGTLEKVVFGDLIDTVPKDMCLDETHLSSITFGANTKVVGESAFSGCSYLDSVTFSAGITTIGKSAFSGCTDLDAISFPESLTFLGEYAFEGCTSLKNITFPTTITELPEGVFAATGITSLVLPDNITTIGEYAFSGCTDLDAISLPESLTSLGVYAFADCTGLDTITSYAIVPPHATSESFDNIDKTIPLYVPTQSVNRYKVAEGWIDFENIQPIGDTIASSFQISVQADNTENGFVMGGGEYMEGDTAVIMATPRKDCTFEGWNDGVTLNPRSVIVTGDSAFTAFFRRTIPLPVVVCSDTMYFTSGDTTMLAIRVYSPSEIEDYDKIIIATIDNKNIMGAQAVEDEIIRNYRQTVTYVPNMDIANVSVAEVVPNGSYFRLRVADGEMAPRCEDCYQALNQLYATEIGADWYFAQYGNSVIPEAAAYANRMILYNEEAPRFSSYRQVTGLNRSQTTVFKLQTPRNIPHTPEEIPVDTASMIEEEKPMEDIPVSVEPQDTVAVISTPYVNFVHSFSLIIWADEARTQVLLVITYDAEGHLLNVTRPSTVRRIPAAGMEISFEVNGLKPNQVYHYTLVACEDDGSILTSLNSAFETATIVTDVQNVTGDPAMTLKILRNGQILIIRGNKTYTITGQEIKLL